MKIDSLFVILVSGCNLRCSYCYEGKEVNKFIDFKTIDNLYKFLLKNTPINQDCNLTCFGGEPFTNFPGIEYMLKLSASIKEKLNRKIKISIITNGTLFTRENLSIIKKYEDALVDIQISCDGIMYESNKERFKSEKQFRNLLDNIDLAVEMFPGKVSIHTVLSESGFKNMFAQSKYFFEKGIRTIGYEFPHVIENQDHIWKNPANIKVYEEQLILTADYLKNHMHRLNVDVDAQLELIEKELTKQNKTCTVGENFIAMSVDGGLYPCHRYYFDSESDPPFFLGNVNEGINIKTFEAKLKLFLSYNLSDRFDKDPLCKGCTAACKQCEAFNQHKYGDRAANDHQFCEFYWARERIYKRFYEEFKLVKEQRKAMALVSQTATS